jgi:FkbM family methyltransferase
VIALQIRRFIIRLQNILRRRFSLEVHRFWPEPPEANLLPMAISDVLLRRVLAGRGTDLTFLQIGANDGMTGDPIHAFVTKYGFRGVVIEPQPVEFVKLQETYRSYPSIVCEQAAIAPSDGAMNLYHFVPGPGVPEWAHLLTSFSPDVLRTNFQDIHGDIEPISVPALSIPTLLAKHNLDVVDLVQIDTEGFDFEIIKHLLPHLRPTILHFESALLLPSERHACAVLLAESGYTVTRNGGDTLAYREPAEQARTPPPTPPPAYEVPRIEVRASDGVAR